MKQSRIKSAHRRNLQSTLERLPKTGCEYLEKTIREILGSGTLQTINKTQDVN